MRRSTKVWDLLAIVVVGVGSFILSAVWYSPWLFGFVWESDAAAESTPAWSFALAPLREILSAAVVLFLIRRTRASDWRSALALGLVLWAGFYVVQLAGAVIWDTMPWELGAVHAGDWLMKMLVMATALGAWARRSMRARHEDRGGAGGEPRAERPAA
jgi:hypothetical protein